MVAQRKPKVVVLGGGTGMPVLLQGLKKYPLDLTAVVTVADDGGSTGKIRNAINVPAPGDVRNVIAALANVDDDLYELFQYRIKENTDLTGHALGNLLLVATNEITGNFNDAVGKVARLFNVKANIFPIVNEPVTLHAEMEDGTIVSGESNIPIKNKKIKRVFITPENVVANELVVGAIRNADLIVISPGSLYTSILPNLIINDVVDALKETKAPTVYVCNIMTQHGETNDYTASDHVKAIYNHIHADIIDTIIVHNKRLEPTVLQAYEREDAYQVTIDYEELNRLNLTIIEKDMVDSTHDIIRHNYKKMAPLLFDLAKNMKK